MTLIDDPAYGPVNDFEIDSLFNGSGAQNSSERTQKDSARTASEGDQGIAAQTGSGNDFSLSGETEAEARQKIEQREACYVLL
jgi:hypothetical protein